MFDVHFKAAQKSITVLSRRFDKLLFPECAAYFLRYRLQQENAFEQDQLDFTWQQAYECVQSISSITNTSHIVLNSNCIREIEGRNISYLQMDFLRWRQTPCIWRTISDS